MPWTISDVNRFKKGLTSVQKRQWVRIANNALKRCIKAGGTDTTCAASAIRQANGVVGNLNSKIMENVKSQLTNNYFIINNYEVQKKTVDGVEYLIVPVIMMTEGVRDNGISPPTLYLAEELSHEVERWNNKPITIYHPRNNDGTDVSVESPDAIQNIKKIGILKDAQIIDNKLKANAWIKKDILQSISTNLLESIENLYPMDVSIGIFSELEPITGQFNNQQYEAIARNIIPDHLALLPGVRGACDWDDGCGIRTNQFKSPESGNAPQAIKSILQRVYSDCKRRWIEEHPRDKENVTNIISCSGAWHAVEQDGWKKDIEGNWNKININLNKNENEVEKINLTTKEMYNNLLKENIIVCSDVISELIENDTGFREVIDSIQSKLDSMDGNLRYYFLEDVFPENYFIYRVRNRESNESSLFKRGYSINEDGTVNFNDDTVQVRKESPSYVEINSNSNEIKRFRINKTKTNIMDNLKKVTSCAVQALIDNEATKWTAEDKEFLEGMTEEQFSKLIPNEAKKDDLPPKEKINNAAKNNNDPKLLAEAIKDFFANQKDEDVIKLMPEKYQEQMNSALSILNYRRKKLVGGIVSNSTYKEEEIKSYLLPTLEKLYENLVGDLGEVNDFSANADFGDDHSLEEQENFEEEINAMVRISEEPKK